MNEDINNAVEELEERPTIKPKTNVTANNAIKMNSFVLLKLKKFFQFITLFIDFNQYINFCEGFQIENHNY